MIQWTGWTWEYCENMLINEPYKVAVLFKATQAQYAYNRANPKQMPIKWWAGE